MKKPAGVIVALSADQHPTVTTRNQNQTLSSMWMILLGAHARMCFKSRQKADCLKYLDIYSAIEKGQVPSRAGSHFTLFFCVEMKALRPHKVVKYKKKR